GAHARERVTPGRGQDTVGHAAMPTELAHAAVSDVDTAYDAIHSVHDELGAVRGERHIEYGARPLEDHATRCRWQRPYPHGAVHITNDDVVGFWRWCAGA